MFKWRTTDFAERKGMRQKCSGPKGGSSLKNNYAYPLKSIWEGKSLHPASVGNKSKILLSLGKLHK
jgi:hypothetical protein